MIFKKTKTQKIQKLIKKADKFLSKGKIKKALKKYKKALDLDPSQTHIYDKLIEAKDMTSKEWKQNDFIESVSWAMKKQEQENPTIKQVHARLSPEWNKATELVFKLLSSEDEEHINSIVEEIVSMGETGTRATVEIILNLKNSTKTNPVQDDNTEK